MSESSQPIISFQSSARVEYPGIGIITLQNIVNVGNVLILADILFQNTKWMRVRRNTTGTTAAGQFWGFHNFIHPLLDPTKAGPPYIMRISEVILADFGGSVGRIFFGIGEFTDATDRTTLRGCGFYCDETGNWFALLNDALGDRTRVDTLASTTVPRYLRIDMDGNLKVVRWYVDEVLVATAVLATALDQISPTTGLRFYDVEIQSAAGNQIDAYISAGPRAQMSIVTNIADAVVPPSLAQDFTYQRVLNLARTRHPSFSKLTFDDNMVIDELNSMASTMLEEGSMADHSAFQHVVNWKADVFPSLDQSAGQKDLRDYADIILPGYVTGVYAIEAIRSDGTKIIVQTKRKESEIRDRLQEADSLVVSRARDPKAVPRGYKVWDPTLRVWKIQKDEAGDSNPWQDVTDANTVVDGVPVPLVKRADLLNNIPLPYQALLPLVERYAVTLAGRAGLEVSWREQQREVAKEAMEKWREFIGDFDMLEDEPFDPEID